MKTVGLGFYYEDLPLGLKFKTVGRTVTEPDIVTFINTIGMTEVLFTNQEFLYKEAGYKGRLAPGSLVYCFAEGLLAQSTMQGTGLAYLGMEHSVKGPVYAGDTIHVECEVIESRLSNTRPGRGFIRTLNKIVKQDGTVVQEYNPLRMIKCRPAGDAK